MRILLIEDDHVLGSAIENHIQYLGHGVDWIGNLGDALVALKTVKYDIILLDINLPDGNGINFLEEIRSAKVRVPVIITTAQDQVQPRIEALNLGADDFLVKPFDLDELLARIEAVLRRADGSNISPSTKFTINDITIDRGRKQVIRGSEQVQLTSKEWVVLECLIRNKSTVVSKSTIEDSLYSFGSSVESNAVEVFVSRIRKKLGNNAIKTVRGIGYLLGNDQ